MADVLSKSPDRAISRRKLKFHDARSLQRKDDVTLDAAALTRVLRLADQLRRSGPPSRPMTIRFFSHLKMVISLL